MSNKNQIIGLSQTELKTVAKLILNTINADKANAKSGLQNYYMSYLKLETEGDKKKYSQNLKFICEESTITESTWNKKRSLFNQCIKQGVSVDKFESEAMLQKALKAVKVGTKKVLKNGAIKTDVKNSAKLETEKVEIQAVNENEIISLMAMSEFKTAVKFLDDNGILKSTFMKAWAKVQASNHE